ncbi:holin [Sporolactobacillus sp. THM7-4]|nr:holin [Sporolactobacillus sp. THM7-4]
MGFADKANEMITGILIISSIITPVITAVVQAVKRAGLIGDNFLPLTAFGIGLFLGFCSSSIFTDAPMAYLIWAGGISGLAATGLFENFKNRS